MKTKTPSLRKPRFRATDAREPALTEGRTYLARVTKDPWKGYPNHRSLIGRLVKVSSEPLVRVEWPGGGGNTFARSCVEVIGEVVS